MGYYMGITWMHSGGFNPPLRWKMWTLSGGKCSAPMENDPFYGVKKELKSKIYADYGMIMEYYSYLCRPIYIVLHWESLINIRLN
jgi:hypothetical protein